MSVLVAYESMYGNTRQIAEAVAEGLKPLGDVKLASVNSGDEANADAEIVIVGGPTHMHGLATSMSRKAAAEAAKEDQDIEMEPGAEDGPGLREWLGKRDGKGKRAAAFDTRIDKSPILTGEASRGIAKRLRRRGYEIVADHESFFVEDSEGPLEAGELERARAWGAQLAEKLG